MVVAGGVDQALMLPLIGIGTLYLRHRQLPEEVRPSGWITVTLWGATFVIVVLMGYYIVLTLR